MSKRIRVVKSEIAESTEILAENIVKIGEAVDAMSESNLTEEALVVLLHHKLKPHVGMTQIRDVMSGLRQLRGWYVRESPDEKEASRVQELEDVVRKIKRKTLQKLEGKDAMDDAIDLGENMAIIRMMCTTVLGEGSK